MGRTARSVAPQREAGEELVHEGLGLCGWDSVRGFRLSRARNVSVRALLLFVFTFFLQKIKCFYLTTVRAIRRTR